MRGQSKKLKHAPFLPGMILSSVLLPKFMIYARFEINLSFLKIYFSGLQKRGYNSGSLSFFQEKGKKYFLSVI
jgi:hypothetical protein